MKLLFFGAAIFFSAQHGLAVSTYFPAASVPEHSIVITELFADPSPQLGLPPVEFVEIYNRSNDPVNLSGWTFYEGSAKSLPAVLLPAGGYLVICAAADTTWFVNYGMVAGISSFSLTNSGEKIAIRNASGISIDSLTYSDEWFDGSYKADGGWSLERVDFDFTCFNTSNWKASVNSSGGTPGTLNSIAGIFVDEEPPVPLNAFCPDPFSVTIRFSEPLEPIYMDSILVEMPVGYQVSAISPGSADNKQVLVTVIDSIPAGIQLQMVLSKVRDCPGNVMPGEQTILFGIPDTFLMPEIIINELLFNPPEGGADFIELYNHGPGIADLTRLSVISFDETTGLPDEVVEIDGDPWLLFPGTYAVLSESPESVDAYYNSPFPRGFPLMNDLPAMNIDAGDIGIMVSGQVIDRVYYEETYHFPLLNDFKGVSLERISPDRPSGDRSNWHSASEPCGFATPGLKNSQFSSAESNDIGVKATPEVFSPDNDGKDDVVTFSIAMEGAGYIGNIVIFHSEGRPVVELVKQQLTGTETSYSWDGTDANGERAPLGLYVAVLQFHSLEGTVHRYRIPVVLAGDL